MRSRLFALAFLLLLGGFSYLIFADTPTPATLVPANEIEPGMTYTMDEVANHSDSEDCWSVVDGVVYDLTEWIGRHPGGSKSIESMCGQDGTAGFNSFHGDDESAANPLVNMQVGELEG